MIIALINNDGKWSYLHLESHHPSDFPDFTLPLGRFGLPFPRSCFPWHALCILGAHNLNLGFYNCAKAALA